MHDGNAQAILEFHNVTWADVSQLMSGVSAVTVSLAPSELAMVLQKEHADRLPVCDLASGLVEPSEGHINFMGSDWKNMTPCQQSDMRHKIGRVFEYSSWISNLTVYDNIVLSELHNTARPASEIHAEVEDLLKEFDISSVPDGRPDAIRPVELRKCELVRAFLGSPDLFLLESPEVGLPGGVVTKLMNMLQRALDRGAAAIWLTQSKRTWGSVNLKNTLKFRKKDDKTIIEGEYNDA